MPQKAHTLVLIAILFLPAMAQARESVRPESAPGTEATPARPGNLPPDSRLEELIREVYRTYETLVGRSGHDLHFRLSQFETILRHEFNEHEFLEVMPPDAGLRIFQVPTYYEAPWLRIGKVVHYELEWRPASKNERKVAADKMAFLAGASIAEALQLERELWNLDRTPLGVTTFLVDLTFAGRERSYRAAATWNAAEGLDRFNMEIVDRVVPELENAMVEQALPLTATEFKNIQQPPISRENERQTSSGLFKAAPLEQGCEQDVNELDVSEPVTLDDDQGHQDGQHEAELRLTADCHYSTDCSVQCVPEIFFKICRESSDADLPFLCEHTPHLSPQVDGAAAFNRAVSCGGAIACGIKECCEFAGGCGGVSISFSGAGAGLTATVTNTGSGRTFNLSISDSIECPAPTQPVLEDPCLGSSLTSGGRIAAATCIDGPMGGTEPAPSDGPTGCIDCVSPILIDLDRSGIALTDSQNGVWFDIEPGREIERVAWTAPQSRDGFLVLDRNGNGLIDSGAELFGNSTSQPPSDDPNGFRALQVFDLRVRGGDSDGWLTAQDDVYTRLRLWQDNDHDGDSDQHELLPLAVAGIEAIELSYIESRRRDQHGNEFRYKSRVRLQQSTAEAADVFLLTR